jgi:hypothetical protein|uniref:Uncharacterized protein n=1 Tax=Zea mays TaxID=4577 RepID=C0PAG1_MAIZE|nr:unknown [Zea mays]
MLATFRPVSEGRILPGLSGSAAGDGLLAGRGIGGPGVRGGGGVEDVAGGESSLDALQRLGGYGLRVPLEELMRLMQLLLVLLVAARRHRRRHLRLRLVLLQVEREREVAGPRRRRRRRPRRRRGRRIHRHVGGSIRECPKRRRRDQSIRVYSSLVKRYRQMLSPSSMRLPPSARSFCWLQIYVSVE